MDKKPCCEKWASNVVKIETALNLADYSFFGCDPEAFEHCPYCGQLLSEPVGSRRLARRTNDD